MGMKISVGLQKKVGQPNYGSLGASCHVEPTPEGYWKVDLSPVKGPLLGPYRKRQEALDAEIQWLEESWLNPAS